MRDWALFINGIYRSVLEEILATQRGHPDFTLFLQPHSGSAIARLRRDVPTPEAPVTLYASTTDELDAISYTAEIVGWENKLEMGKARQLEVDGIIRGPPARRRRTLRRISNSWQPQFESASRQPNVKA